MYPQILETIKGYKQADNYIKNNANEALDKVSEFYPNCNSIASLNGIIGGKNGNYKCKCENYNSHIEYYCAWRNGHSQKYSVDKVFSFTRTSVNINNLLEDPFLEEFISVYLSRTFFKKHGIK